MDLTKQLAGYAAGLQYKDLAEETVQNAKKCILDWAGVCIRGSQETPIQILRAVLGQNTGADQATVLTSPLLRTAAWDAAFLNGAASHSLDFDDLHNASIIHLATVVVPPALAVTEAEHKSGRDLITAVVAGYEVGARVGETIIPESYYFWHTTGTAGIFGAAAAAGRALGLNDRQMLYNLGTAGTQAAGLWEFVAEGTMSKPIHAGKASYAGVLSAYISARGFTGATHILEGEKGFCRALSPDPHWSKLTDGLGNGTFKIDENSFKPYACCKHAHAAIFAGTVLRKECDLGEMQEITVEVNDITDSLINNAAPQTPYGCKFSIQYCLACALVYGEVGIEHFTPQGIEDTAIRDVIKKIKVERSAEIEQIKADDPTKLASRVHIVKKNGETLAKLVEYPKGDPANTMTIEEIRAKYDSLAVPIIGAQAAAEIAELILHLDTENAPGEVLQKIALSMK